MRRAARVDENQADIVRALVSIGCSVQSLAAIGKGCPDLLVGLRGTNFLIEVKNPAKVPSERRLTSDQVSWHGSWRGNVHVVETPAEALRIVSGDFRAARASASTLRTTSDQGSPLNVSGGKA